uniref:Pentatricopeptide repeat-containing protein At5g27270 family n=1 Tax=Cajanus cajan TaxID=3821 RepID=A0A151R718_CAJCA|nr:Pentatricopeptide repeat-containing protein At5g27270 family [Cajanus cajan]
MECLKSPFIFSTPLVPPPFKKKKPRHVLIRCSVQRDPWSPSSGDPARPKPRTRSPKKPLSDDNARRIIKSKAAYLSVLRRNQGPQAQTPRWIKRTPEQMVQYLQDDRNGHLYGRHVVAAIKRVRSLSQRHDGDYDMRMEMASFVGKLTFKEMCTVLKEQKGWRQVRDFFAWMKLQLSYRPSVIVYTIVLRLYGQVGKLKLAEEIFLEMLDADCEPDEVACGTMLCSYARWGRHKAMLSFYSAVKERGIFLSVAVFNFMLSSLQKKSLHREVVEVSLIKEGLHEDAFKTFDEMRNNGIVPEEVTYSLLINLNTKIGNRDGVQRLYENMRIQGIIPRPPDAGSCNDMLSLYMGLNLMNKAKEFIVRIREDGTHFDKELYRTVMKVYCKEGMLPEAEQLTNQMFKNESFKNDNFNKTKILLKLLGYAAGGSKIVSQLIISLSKDGEISKAELLNHQLIKLGCRMEEATVASLISHYGKQQMLKQAEDIFAEYVNSPTSSKLLYNSMINAYAKCGKQEKAYSLYKQVTEEGCDLGAVGISIAVNSLTNGGKHQEAENIVRRSLEENLELDTVAYNTFIKAMLEAGKLHFASSIFERMCSSGFAPSIETFNTMISVYGQDQKLDKAVEIFNKASSFGVSLDEKTYMNLIGYYGKAGMMLEVSQLFSKMQEEGIKPGKVSYNIMINVYANAGVLNETEKLFQAMQRQGCLPDSFTYLSLVQAYTRSLNYSKAEETIHDMQSKGIPPSCVHFNILLHAFTKAGLIDEAKRVYDKLSTFGLIPDLVCYRTMLNGYLKCGCVKEGINFFESIYESTKSDGFILSAAVHFYKSAGNESKAEEILSSMNNLRIPFLKKLEVGSGERLKTP